MKMLFQYPVPFEVSLPA